MTPGKKPTLHGLLDSTINLGVGVVLAASIPVFIVGNEIRTYLPKPNDYGFSVLGEEDNSVVGAYLTEAVMRSPTAAFFWFWTHP